MAVAVPLFALVVEYWLDVALLVLALALLLWALIHLIPQRADAFTAIGGLTKTAWLAILGVIFGLTLLLGLPVFLSGTRPLTLFSYIGLGASAYYLLETRRGLKDAAEGHW